MWKIKLLPPTPLIPISLRPQSLRPTPFNVGIPLNLVVQLYTTDTTSEGTFVGDRPYSTMKNYPIKADLGPKL